MAREIICDSCGERQEGPVALNGHTQVILRLGGPHGDTRDEIKIDLCDTCRKKLKILANQIRDGQMNLREGL